MQQSRLANFLLNIDWLRVSISHSQPFTSMLILFSEIKLPLEVKITATFYSLSVSYSVFGVFPSPSYIIAASVTLFPRTRSACPALLVSLVRIFRCCMQLWLRCHTYTSAPCFARLLVSCTTTTFSSKGNCDCFSRL